MRNLLMLLVAVLGTSVMVHAFPPQEAKTVPAKETAVKKHHKHHKAHKESKTTATPNAPTPKTN